MAAFTHEAAALERVEFPWRIAPFWVDPEYIEVRFEFQDGADHFASFYFLEWTRQNAYRLRVEFLDGETLELLDAREIGELNDGKYFSWLVRGTVVARIHRLTANSVLSGIFLDPPPIIEEAPMLFFHQTGSGSWRLLVVGNPGQLFALEQSEDLERWRPLRTSRIESGAFVDLGEWPVSENGARFYRSRLLSLP